MACGEPSSSVMKQIHMAICQLCGRDMQSSGQKGHAINYQKQVDPPATPYKQIIPDYRYDELEEAERKKRGGHSNSGKVAPTQVCIQFPVVPGKSQTDSPGKDTTTEKSSPQKADESGAKDQSQPGGTVSSPVMKINRLLLFLLASCLPAGCGGCPQPVKMMLCLPCPPPDCAGSSSAGAAASTPCNKNKPKDYTYRCESRELRGGNLYQCCQCNKRNGLQHDCPRTPCQGRPACLTKPWPDCWPSGGCHGIDYTREKGVKRIDPCRESRFDKKECKPPGGAKADCGGNMMVVVCPPPSPC